MSRFIVFFALLGIGLAANIPSYLKPCKISDSKCITEHSNAVLQHILKGDSQFKIPNLNPLVLPKVTLESAGGLTINFTNLHVLGIPDIKITSVVLDGAKKTGKVEFFYPRTELKGDYTGHGKILIVTLDAADKALLIAEEGKYTWTFNYDLIDKKGVKYGKITEHHTDFKLKKAIFDFKNVVNGDEKLSAATNKILNDEWEAVLEDLKGGIGDTIGSVLNLILQSYMNKIPFNELVEL